MKKLTILVAALIFVGSAHAQSVVRAGSPAQINATAPSPAAPQGPMSGRSANTLGFVAAGATNNGATPTTTFTNYGQDAYLEQTGNNNYAITDQTDGRVGALVGGSSAAARQTGNNSNAYQTQTLNSSSTGALRNQLSIDQRGNSNEARQTQVGGFGNQGQIEQITGTFNRATQTQDGNGTNNSARIYQVRANSGGGDNNQATQTQTGGNNKRAQINQEGDNGYAQQTQTGTNGSTAIGQGYAGENNTAIQSQSGTDNRASINQSVGLPTASNNYAAQTQIGNGDQASINQNSNGNYARQDQSGASGFTGGQNNNSIINQGTPSTTNMISTAVSAAAAYTNQTGMMNQATINQR